MEEESLIEVHDFPEDLGPNPRGDLLITTFHGEDHFYGPLAGLMAKHEQDLSPEDQAVFGEYLALEMDAYSHELALEVIRVLQGETPDLRIRYLRFRLQRALLDGNRADVDESRRRLWSPEEHKIWRDLGLLHGDMMRDFAHAMPDKAFVHALDLHTMYPFSPVQPQVSAHQALSEARGGVEAYTRSYLDAEKNGGVRRPLDLICNDGVGRLMANGDWVSAAEAKFTNAGVLAQRNSPYSLGSKALNSKRVLSAAERAGLVLDVPKVLFVDEPPSDGQYRPGLLAPEKLKMMGGLIADSYLVSRVN